MVHNSEESSDHSQDSSSYAPVQVRFGSVIVVVPVVLFNAWLGMLSVPLICITQETDHSGEVAKHEDVTYY
jgi:hypothetical protein